MSRHVILLQKLGSQGRLPVMSSSNPRASCRRIERFELRPFGDPSLTCGRSSFPLKPKMIRSTQSAQSAGNDPPVNVCDRVQIAGPSLPDLHSHLLLRHSARISVKDNYKQRLQASPISPQMTAPHVGLGSNPSRWGCLLLCNSTQSTCGAGISVSVWVVLREITSART